MLEREEYHLLEQFGQLLGEKEKLEKVLVGIIADQQANLEKKAKRWKIPYFMTVSPGIFLSWHFFMWLGKDHLHPQGDLGFTIFETIFSALIMIFAGQIVAKLWWRKWIYRKKTKSIEVISMENAIDSKKKEILELTRHKDFQFEFLWSIEQQIAQLTELSGADLTNRGAFELHVSDTYSLKKSLPDIRDYAFDLFTYENHEAIFPLIKSLEAIQDFIESVDKTQIENKEREEKSTHYRSEYLHYLKMTNKRQMNNTELQNIISQTL